ncbi:unnamed protein product [Mytilus coruscus]|uniref:Uncharacterized protein n=1 Tax=Mytilus coruscus TaxID=42192 RepID=A0A6J8B7S2_MYTCO|nr:unnamed protein product [Mytilus coruscus]
MLRSTIIAEPKVSYTALIDNTVSIPIAVYYKPKAEKLGTKMKQQILKVVTIVQTCLGCLQSPTLSGDGQIVRESNGKSECGQCIELGVVCTECTDIGHQSAKPPLRACDHCVKNGRQCIRTLVVAVTTDCEQGNKNAFQMKINDRETGQLYQSFLFSVLPDAVHVGKTGNVKKKLIPHSDAVKSFYLAQFQGGIVFTDTKKHRVKAYDGQDITDLAGSGQIGHGDGSATSASFSQPMGITANFEYVVVVDANSGRIRIISIWNDKLPKTPGNT